MGFLWGPFVLKRSTSALQYFQQDAQGGKHSSVEMAELRLQHGRHLLHRPLRGDPKPQTPKPGGLTLNPKTGLLLHGFYAGSTRSKIGMAIILLPADTLQKRRSCNQGCQVRCQPQQVHLGWAGETNNAVSLNNYQPNPHENTLASL